VVAATHPFTSKDDNLLNTNLVWLLTVVALVSASAFALRRRMAYWRTICLLAFVAYCGALVAVTLFPIPIDSRLIGDMTQQNYLQNNFVPLRTVLSTWAVGPKVFALQVGGNLALLFPLGLLLPVLWPPATKARVGLATVTLASFLIEGTQFLISLLLGVTYKQVDVDDLILNVIGGAVGFACFFVVSRAFTALRRTTPALTGDEQ